MGSLVALISHKLVLEKIVSKKIEKALILEDDDLFFKIVLKKVLMICSNVHTIGSWLDCFQNQNL